MINLRRSRKSGCERSHPWLHPKLLCCDALWTRVGCLYALAYCGYVESLVWVEELDAILVGWIERGSFHLVGHGEVRSLHGVYSKWWCEHGLRGRNTAKLSTTLCRPQLPTWQDGELGRCDRGWYVYQYICNNDLEYLQKRLIGSSIFASRKLNPSKVPSICSDKIDMLTTRLGKRQDLSRTRGHAKHKVARIGEGMQADLNG